MLNSSEQPLFQIEVKTAPKDQTFEICVNNQELY